MPPLSKLPATVEFREASVHDIGVLIEKLQPILLGEEKHTAGMACLMLVMMLQHPDLTLDELFTGVKGASKWIADYLKRVTEPNFVPTHELPKTQVN